MQSLELGLDPPAWLPLGHRGAGFSAACCTDPGLWCHTFNQPPNATGASTSPSLCLPIPQVGEGRLHAHAPPLVR